MIKVSTRFCLSSSKYLQTILGTKPVKTATTVFVTEIELHCQVEDKEQKACNKDDLENQQTERFSDRVKLFTRYIKKLLRDFHHSAVLLVI